MLVKAGTGNWRIRGVSFNFAFETSSGIEPVLTRCDMFCLWTSNFDRAELMSSSQQISGLGFVQVSLKYCEIRDGTTYVPSRKPPYFRNNLRKLYNNAVCAVKTNHIPETNICYPISDIIPWYPVSLLKVPPKMVKITMQEPLFLFS